MNELLEEYHDKMEKEWRGELEWMIDDKLSYGAIISRAFVKIRGNKELMSILSENGDFRVYHFEISQCDNGVINATNYDVEITFITEKPGDGVSSRQIYYSETTDDIDGKGGINYSIKSTASRKKDNIEEEGKL